MSRDMHKDMDAIERDIEASRDRLNDTIDSLQQRMTGRGIVNEVFGIASESAKPVTEAGLTLLKRHPIPMMATAASVGWVLYSLYRDYTQTVEKFHHGESSSRISARARSRLDKPSLEDKSIDPDFLTPGAIS